jgi:hypothetical protein
MAGLDRKQEVTVKDVFYSSNSPAYFGGLNINNK